MAGGFGAAGWRVDREIAESMKRRLSRNGPGSARAGACVLCAGRSTVAPADLTTTPRSGAFFNYTRLSNVNNTNFFGLGGRIGFNVASYAQIEFEGANDFQRDVNDSFARSAPYPATCAWLTFWPVLSFRSVRPVRCTCFYYGQGRIDELLRHPKLYLAGKQYSKWQHGWRVLSGRLGSSSSRAGWERALKRAMRSTSITDGITTCASRRGRCSASEM